MGIKRPAKWVLNNPHSTVAPDTRVTEGVAWLGLKDDHGPHALPSSDRPFLGDAVSRLARSLPIAEMDRMWAAHSAYMTLSHDGNQPISVGGFNVVAGHDVSTE